ncbi:AAA family ATPase [Phocaeicola vulgatus]|uniref:ATP-binding protein n=1 Tax=Phocaeicola vulgatus TaxID=821 RepID=UPI001C386454|nr:ATP-binding protein [Phocaeicola vulgatus]MBV3851750.1 AAA family ATPase [Phocaeicola vulgatus]MBV3860808.1 AAA family ATPase [Phocaeicola vulgatus]MBV3864846.1 AAA family ATPase [Phocaeicola vulgatus]MBV3872451.1 AAA family ATPase [Phocaeicola vulgatus]MBV3889939.1 AAA family ATPase [Phocaeicola vulgatus]
MKESIIIKNFGPLKEVEIDDIKPLTVFIGKSAGGKSIIMKVIVLMRYIYKMVNIRSYLKNAKITRSPFKLRFNSLLHDGLKGMITAQTEIYYTVEINGNKYTLKYTNRGLQSDINIPDKDLIFFKEAYVSGMRSLIPIWASKAVSVKGENLGFFFHETFNDFNDATDVIKEQKLEYLNLKMKVRKSGNRPKLFTIESLQNDAVPIELRYASSGIQTSAPLVAIVHYFAQEFSFKDAFQRSVLNYLYKQDLLTKFTPGINRNKLGKYVHIHIEEVELSLAPEDQRAFMSNLVEEVFHKNKKDRKLGLMVSTHNPYIVNHLNVLLRAGYFEKARENYPFLEKDDIAVYRVNEGKIISLMATDNDTGEYVINALDMSDTMERIFEEYESMEE